jgi:excisionase family DNA binding protein
MRCNEVTAGSAHGTHDLGGFGTEQCRDGRSRNVSKHKRQPWWTTLEIAVRWRVSRRTVQRKTHTGELPVVQISERVRRVRGVDLERYEREHGMPNDDAA